MMNAKEISNRKFEKSKIGGYKSDDVDQFLRDVAIGFAQLQKEKEDCEKKIDVLADKVREYMKDEEALKEALLGAQRQGHKVIEDSQLIANKIVNEANENADKILSQTKIQHENEKNTLSRMQKEVSDFKAKLLTLYKSHLDLITAMPDVDDYDEVEEIVNTELESSHDNNSEHKSEVKSQQNKDTSYPFSNPTTNKNDGHYSDLKFGNNNK